MHHDVDMPDKQIVCQRPSLSEESMRNFAGLPCTLCDENRGVMEVLTQPHPVLSHELEVPSDAQLCR